MDATAALQDCGLADPARTVANGGSAGGLLMGAVANLAPERYAGIEADVPFVDALTTMLDPSLPLTVTEWDEWGTRCTMWRRTATCAGIRRMRTRRCPRMTGASTSRRSPSPRPPSRRAPCGATARRWRSTRASFVTTSMNDMRVLVVEPLKWVARLQAAGLDAVIKVEVEAGHGGGTGRYKRWRDVCYENAWCLDVMRATELM